MVTINRKLIGFALIVIIIIGGIFVWLNKDKYFKSEIIVTYPDGCIEKFINTELITPICKEGRILEEKDNRPGMMPFMYNINWTNNKSEN